MDCGSHCSEMIMGEKTWKQTGKAWWRSRKLDWFIHTYKIENEQKVDLSQGLPPWVTSSIEALPPKGFKIFPNNAISWVPRVQTYKPMGSILHSQHPFRGMLLSWCKRVEKYTWHFWLAVFYLSYQHEGRAWVSNVSSACNKKWNMESSLKISLAESTKA